MSSKTELIIHELTVKKTVEVFIVFEDYCHDGYGEPIAVFTSLEKAKEWASGPHMHIVTGKDVGMSGGIRLDPSMDCRENRLFDDDDDDDYES
jgi:hypothetical protein